MTPRRPTAGALHAQPQGRTVIEAFNSNRQGGTIDCQVLIIGGGVTGAGLARDLALRGVTSVLVEKRDANAGASGGNHGLLHSGARYISSDPAAAWECRAEGELLKRLAPETIEDVGGLFVAVAGDDERYIADFPGLCEKQGVPAWPVDVAEAREMEPILSDRIIAAYGVKDASIDPFRLSFNNLAQASDLGCAAFFYNRVHEIQAAGGRIHTVEVVNDQNGLKTRIKPQIVVNASGAWADRVASLVGLHIDMIYSKGALLITPRRYAHRVINRLRKASDADIIVPGGTVSILGTTSTRVHDPDNVRPEVEEVEYIIRECADMAPMLEESRFIRAYCGVRPLVKSGGGGDDRNVSRGYHLIDHAEQGVENFITITGGKLTTYRLMAEKTADLVADRLGVTAPCRTRTEPLPDPGPTRYTEAGLTAREALTRNDPRDPMICDCEMTPQSVVDEIAEEVRKRKSEVGMVDIQHRSRVGKGSCQGTFCSQRLIAHLFDRGVYEDPADLKNMKAFIQERWRGQQPVLWGLHMVQADLQEAILCGLLGLEQIDD